MSRRLLVVLSVPLIFAAALRAEDPKLPSAKDYDKLIVDTLKEVHNTGAELYNNYRDFNGAYRMYQGALLTVRPLLAQRPAAQKLIDEGLAAADKELAIGQKAFKLHETIEAVRTLLKSPPGATTKVTPDEPKKSIKPDEPKTTKPDEPKKTTKPDEPKKTIKPDEPKTLPLPKPQYELAPPPREKKEAKPKTNPPTPLAEVHGTVTVDGEPVERGSILFTPLDDKSWTVGAVIEKGKYTVAKVPTGSIKVEIRVPKVTGKKQLYGKDSKEVPTYSEMLPRKYNSDSELRFNVQPGVNNMNWELSTKLVSTTEAGKPNPLAGKVILRGQPLTAAEVTLVSLDQAKPKVFTAAIKADGSYAFTEMLPPGKYVVIVTAKSVPEKYQTTTTSGLTFEVPAGKAVFDINLK